MAQDFSEGRKDVEDDELSGHLVMMKTKMWER
jgi:hypothetical protein